MIMPLSVSIPSSGSYERLHMWNYHTKPHIHTQMTVYSITAEVWISSEECTLSLGYSTGPSR